MSRKILSISIVMAVLIGLIANNVAFAATYGNRYGQVTAVTGTSITINNLKNSSRTILVTSNTNYSGVNGRTRSLSYVTVGMWVFASGTVDSSGNLVANNVIITGPRYTSSSYWNYTRAYGTVISVDPRFGEFFLYTAMSGRVKVIVDDNTVYRSSIKKVSDVNEGMKALVAGPVLTNGFIRAKIVVVYSTGN